MLTRTLPPPLHQFLSGRVNKRTDDYGGSLENRARIVLRIIDAIKARVPSDFILSMKLNSADFSEGGLTDEESRTVASWLDAKGVDLIECVSRSLLALSPPRRSPSDASR